MLTRTEARMKAAAMALEAVQQIRVWEELPEAEDWGPVAHKLKEIEHWLRERAVGGDKITLRQMRRK